MMRRLIWLTCVVTIAALAFAGAAAPVATMAAPAAGAMAPAAPGPSQSPAAGQEKGTPAPATPALATPAPPPEPVREGLGANMTRYYMVFLRRSGKPAPPGPELRKIMEGHLDNIRRLAGERKLLLAGPFMDQSGPGSLAGIFILATASADEAHQLVDTDPAVAAGRFTAEIVPWLGPKTLARVLEP
jgi:uncharacterized protein YciI